MTALQQLEDHRTTKKWSECAKLMEAVNQLSETFLQYRNIQKINEIFKRIERIRASLKDEITQLFSK